MVLAVRFRPYPTSAAERRQLELPERPREVEAAFWLWLGSVVLNAIGVVLFVALIDRILEAIARFSGADPASIDQAGRIFLFVGGLLGVLFLGLGLLFVFLMRDGSYWARIRLTAVGVTSVLVSLAGYGGLAVLAGAMVPPVVPVVVALVPLALTVAAIYFSFRPAANAYFRRPTRRLFTDF